ncbi:nuclease-related domain-containing protein [Chloroflexota bacterium]
MNTAIIIILAIAAFCVYVCVCVYIQWKLPVWKGIIGEKKVSRKLRFLSHEHYIVLNDLMLPSTGNTNATQIDHVVVSNFGIFCIETKAYKGWIFGGEKQQYWTQTIYRKKTKFFNPLRQNYAHIKAIESLLGPQHLEAPIVPLVVFTRADKMKISGTDSVVHLSGIVRKIKNYSNNIYSDVQRNEIHRLLVDANIVDKQLRKSHIKEIRALQKHK